MIEGIRRCGNRCFVQEEIGFHGISLSVLKVAR
jgi:hypothetical protein